MMRFAEGDTVRVLDGRNMEDPAGISFVVEMAQYIDQEVHITYAGEVAYKIDADHGRWNWADYWFEPVNDHSVSESDFMEVLGGGGDAW